jgi:hypothetical protein
MKTLCLATILTISIAARQPLSERIAHTDPAKYRRTASMAMPAT